MIIFDSKGRIIKINEACSNLLGYFIDDLYGKPLGVIYPQQSEYSTIETIESILKGNITTTQLPFLAKNGRLINVSTRIAQKFIDNQFLFFATSIELTNNQIFKDALVSERQFSEVALNAQRDTFFVFNPKTGKAVRWNKAFREISGYDDEEIARLPAPQSYYNQSELTKLESKTMLVEKGEFILVEADLVTKDGSQIPFEYAASGIFKDNGELEYVVSIGRNIRDRIETQQKLKESETKYRNLFETSPNAIILMDITGKIVEANSSVKKYYGYSREDIVGKQGIDVYNVPEKFHHALREDFKQLLKERTTISREIQIYTKDQTLTWILYRSSLVELENTLLIQVIAQYIQDIKEAEQKLKESEKKLLSIFEAIPDIFFLLSNDSTVLEYKGRLDELYISPEQFLGKKLVDILPEDISSQILPLIRKVLKTKEPQLMEYSLEMPNGGLYYEARLLYLSKKKISVFIRDITERRINEKIIKESEEKYRTIIERNYDGYFEVDLRGNYTHVNQRISDFIGLPRHEIIGNNFRNFINKEDIPRVYNIYHKLYEKKLPQILLTYKLMNKDGTEHHVETAAYLKKDSNNNITGFYGISRDVDLKTQLEESEKKYKDLYEAAPNAYFSIDARGSILNCNQTAVELFGYKKQELLDMNISDLHSQSEDSHEKISTIFNRFLKGGEMRDLELKMNKKNGELVWISMSLKPIFDDHGKVIELRTMMLNIDKRKKAQLLLEESEKKYREAFDQINFYKNLFAHDMNNILHGVLSATELSEFYLNEYDDRQRLVELLGIIKDCGYRGSNLISNVQKLSKLDNTDLSLVETNLYDVLKDAMKFIQPKTQDKEISMYINPFSKEINVWANELLLDVFENIFSNAISYNNKDKIELEVKITEIERNSNPFVKIEFIDNGMGIQDARKQKIFEMGNKDSKGGKGMGIGLSLVKKIVESYSGTIRVQNRVKGDYSMGCNFVVNIPRV